MRQVKLYGLTHLRKKAEVEALTFVHQQKPHESWQQWLRADADSVASHPLRKHRMAHMRENTARLRYARRNRCIKSAEMIVRQ
jgi:hypothetical protein